MDFAATPFALDTKLIDSTLGALAIGFGFSSALFGILATQVYLYFRKFPNDTPFIVSLVAIIFFLEIVDQVLIGHCAYHYTVTTWAQPMSLLTEKPLWSLILLQTFGSLVGTFVKCVFVLRVWRFSNKNWLVTGIIASVVIFQFVCGMIYTQRAFDEKGSLITSLPKLKFIATISLASGALSDLLTAIALAWYLRKLRTGHERSDTLINGLIRYGLSTGFFSAATSLVTLILYNVRPSTFESIGAFMVLSKVLDISLMSSLISRSSHSRGRSASVSQPSRNHSIGGGVLISQNTVKMSDFPLGESHVTTSPTFVTSPSAHYPPPGQYQNYARHGVAV